MRMAILGQIVSSQGSGTGVLMEHIRSIQFKSAPSLAVIILVFSRQATIYVHSFVYLLSCWQPTDRFNANDAVAGIRSGQLTPSHQ